MTRKECLDAAAECVLKDRQNQYGKPEDSFDMIAGLWTAYLGEWITALDVSMMMALLKVARAKANPQHGDSFVDIAGYAACGAELAPVARKKVGFRVRPHLNSFAKRKKAEGCEELVEKDAPQTKEELFSRIVDCNPATFHAPSYAEEQAEHYARAHKPTGEELAEMAEEEGRD